MADKVDEAKPHKASDSGLIIFGILALVAIIALSMVFLSTRGSIESTGMGGFVNPTGFCKTFKCCMSTGGAFSDDTSPPMCETYWDSGCK